MSMRLRGVSFIDVIVGTALLLIVFTAIFGLLRSNLLISSLAKAKAAATALATSQVEYIRSLPYDDVGTEGGIPAGTIPELATSTENGIEYEVRTFVQYIDDPADGEGAADTNGIITDYKRVKVTVSYRAANAVREVELVSNVAPPGIETTTGGGTLRIQVVNASGAAVPGAEVLIANSSLTPEVDLTAFSDASGIVSLPGAATSTEYRIAVSKTGYSSAQTYARDATNQNPTPGYLTVVENQTTTGTFAIDVLAALSLRSYSPIESRVASDALDDASGLASQTNTTVIGGALTLTSSEGVYVSSGSAVSAAVAPTYLRAWTSASSTASLPVGTDARLQIVDGTGALLPDSVVPGNSTGFTDTVDLSGVATTTYPSLAVRHVLTTSDTAQAPQVLGYALGYERGPIPLPSASFTLTGSKTKGTTSSGAAIYKTVMNDTTGASAAKTLSLEWDVYDLSVPNFDVVEACAPSPYTLAPGSATDVALYLDTETPNAVLVSVRDSAGQVVEGATVTLSRTGYTKSVSSSSCGTAYFGNVAASSLYTISIAKSGYVTVNYTGVNVSGQTHYAASFE